MKSIQPQWCPFCARSTTKTEHNGNFLENTIKCTRCFYGGHPRYTIQYKNNFKKIESVRLITEDGMYCVTSSWQSVTYLGQIDYEDKFCNQIELPFLATFDLENAEQIIDRIRILATFY